MTAINTNPTQAAEKVSYILNDTETPLEIGENGLFNFTVNTNELKSIGKIPVTIKAEKHGLTSQSIINIEYYQILTKLYSLLNLGQSNSGLVVILDNTEVTIDNNKANQKLIDKIILSANEYNAGLYVIDTGNEAMQKLAEKLHR